MYWIACIVRATNIQLQGAVMAEGRTHDLVSFPWSKTELMAQVKASKKRIILAPSFTISFAWNDIVTGYNIAGVGGIS